MRIRALLPVATALAGATLTVAACSSDAGRSGDSPDARPPISLGDAAYVDGDEPDANKVRVDGGFAGPDGSAIRPDRFVTKVVSFTPGECAGFGASGMPDVVLGPPVGAGSLKGGLDVVSLGLGGEIVLSFEPNAIVDGPGADFIVFENAFYAAGDPDSPAVDLGEVSVSDDGVTWKTYPCAPSAAPPYGSCAGWHPVYSAPGNGISPIDPAAAGGEAYDLATLGVTSAKYVRIRSIGGDPCTGNPKPMTSGFDLDAVSVVNAATP